MQEYYRLNTNIFSHIYINISTTCFGLYGHRQVGHDMRGKKCMILYGTVQTLVWCKWGTRSRLKRYGGLVELYGLIPYSSSVANVSDMMIDICTVSRMTLTWTLYIISYPVTVHSGLLGKTLQKTGHPEFFPPLERISPESAAVDLANVISYVTVTSSVLDTRTN